MQLKHYVPDKSHVLDPEPLDLDENLSYEENSIEILDSKVRSTRRKYIKMVKVIWFNQRTQEASRKLRISCVRNTHTFFPRLVSYGVVTKFLKGVECDRISRVFTHFLLYDINLLQIYMLLIDRVESIV